MICVRKSDLVVMCVIQTDMCEKITLSRAVCKSDSVVICVSKSDLGVMCMLVVVRLRKSGLVVMCASRL
jgi:hypothetical protein